MQPQTWTNNYVLEHQTPLWLSRKDFFFSSPPLIRQHIRQQTPHPSLHKAVMGSMFQHATWQENKRAFTSEAESRRVWVLGMGALKVWHEAFPSPPPQSLEAQAHTKHRQLLFHSALRYISHPATLHSPSRLLCAPRQLLCSEPSVRNWQNIKPSCCWPGETNYKSVFVFRQRYHWIWNVRWPRSLTCGGGGVDLKIWIHI